jgi:hypothetical protein
MVSIISEEIETTLSNENHKLISNNKQDSSNKLEHTLNNYYYQILGIVNPQERTRYQTQKPASLNKSMNGQVAGAFTQESTSNKK